MNTDMTLGLPTSINNNITGKILLGYLGYGWHEHRHDLGTAAFVWRGGGQTAGHLVDQCLQRSVVLTNQLGRTAGMALHRTELSHSPHLATKEMSYLIETLFTGTRQCNKQLIFRQTVQIEPNFLHWNAHIFLFWFNPTWHFKFHNTSKQPSACYCFQLECLYTLVPASASGPPLTSATPTFFLSQTE